MFIPRSLAAVAFASAFLPVFALGQGLTITNYQLVREERLGGGLALHTLRADVVNSGQARTVLTATVSSPVPNMQIVPGRTNLHFSPIPAGSQVTSLDTFQIQVDLLQPINYNQLQWSFNAPFAVAGPNQTVPLNSTVTLNAGQSSNPSGLGNLSYEWRFLERPPGSAGVMQNSTNVIATFQANVQGTWLIQLRVSNGFGTDVATVMVTTGNSPPVANAGPSQTVPIGGFVTLNGSGSTDVDGDPLTYAWSMTSRPQGSNATLSSTTAVSPTFTADRPGSYVIRLIVNDGKADSQPSTVTIATTNTAPVANAGGAQTVNVGSLVQLSGAGSTDVDGDPLTYVWTLITRPAGSNASLNNPNSVTPTFTADVAGTYVAQLVVNDTKVNSSPSTVTITTGTVQAPTANAGPNQSVGVGATVQLSGGGTDPQSRPLTFQWALITRPAGSTAAINNPTAQNPTFVADRTGTFVAQLIVNNGTVNSAPATVTISTNNTAPVANAGPNQTAPLNSVVQLDGRGSSDANGDPLTYAWTFLSRPNGSTALLQAANSSTPSFTPDVAGTYVVQLIVNDSFVSSAPSTVTITAEVINTSLSPDPLAIQMSSVGTMTLTVPRAAPAGGWTFNVLSANSTIATVPGTVTIPAGATSVTFNVTPVVAGSTNITVTRQGFRPSSAAVNITSAGMNLSLQSSVLGVSRTTNGTVSITNPAPSGGLQVSISASPNGIVSLSGQTVTIVGGATTANFTITGLAEGTATITASAPGFPNQTQNIQVTLNGAIFVQTGVSTAPGSSAPITITIPTPAPAGGLMLNLTSSNTSVATVPATVNIQAGQTQPNPAVQVTGVNFGSSTITAMATGYTSGSASVQVGGTLQLAPQTLALGTGGQGNMTVSLSVIAPSAMSINLNSTNPQVATVPQTVTIPAGSSQATFAVTGVGTGQTTIQATPSGGGVQPVTATVNVSNLGSLQMPPTASLSVGGSAPVQVSLSQAAPAGGVTITLTTTDGTRVSLSQTTVTIPQGATSAGSAVIMTGVGTGTATIGASAPGYGSASTTVTVTGGFQMSPPSANVSSGTPVTLTITLPAPAPGGGFLVNLSSSNTAVATVPASVMVQTGQTTASFQAQTLSGGTAIISAANNGSTQATSTLTVTGSSAITIAPVTGLTPGGGVQLDITLPTPAPQNLSVFLQIANSSIASVSPASAFILAGNTKPNNPPFVTGLAFGSTTIQAAAAGYAPGTQTLNVGAALTFTPNTVTLNPTATQSVQIGLSAPAPPGGVQVAMSSSNGSAVVPPVVNIPQNATGVSFQLTGGEPGTATVTASVTGNSAISPATLTVTVPGRTQGAISLPPATTVQVGQTVGYNISITAPAPSGGLIVSLSSGDTSRVTIAPATVTIPAGATVPAVQPTVTGVALGGATISATASNFTAGTGSVTVAAQASLSVSPNTLSIPAGNTAQFAVQIPNPAPAGGTTINLSSTNGGAASVPASVTIQTGATSAMVTVNGVAPGTAAINVSATGLGTAQVQVTVTQGIAIVMPASFTVTPGQTVAFPVTLSSAPAQQTTVNLVSSSSANFTVTPSVTFAAGSTTPVSGATITGVASGAGTVNATGMNLQPATTNVTVGATLAFTPNTVTVAPGATQNVTVALSAPAAANTTVTLVSANTGIATVPATVVIPAGSSSAQVAVTGMTSGGTSVQATAAGATPATLTVTVLAASNALQVTPVVNILLEEVKPFTVTLPAPAPRDITVNLSINVEHRVTFPATLVIPTGQRTGSVNLTGINVGNAIITASAQGYTSAQGQVIVGATITWDDRGIVQMQPGERRTLFLHMGQRAPWPWEDDGMQFNFTSTNHDVATLRSSIRMYQDGSAQTIVAVVVTAGVPGLATLSVSAINTPTDTVQIRVGNPLTITTASLPAGQVGVGYSTTLGASGGNQPLSWSLQSGVLPAGLNLSANGVLSGTPTATATNVPLTFRVQDASNPPQATTATLNLTVNPAAAGTMTLSPAQLNVQQGGTGTLTVTLSQPAPAGNATVNLSSNNTAAATVPGFIVIPQGSTTGTVTVTGVAAGSATIFASANGFGNAQATATVTSLNSINLPQGLQLTPGQTVPFSITLANPAASNTTVTLAAVTANRVTFSSNTVEFAAGATTPLTPVTITGVGSGTTMVNASGANLANASTTVTINAAMNFTPATGTVNSGNTGTLTLTFGAPLGAATTVSLSSSATGVATVPATVNAAAGATTVQVPFTGVSAGTAVITANASGFPAATANVTVTASGGLRLPALTNMQLEATVPYVVTLPTPAGFGGVTVNFVSSSFLVTVTPSVFIPAGATSGTVQLTGINVGQAFITASAPGFGQATGEIQVGATITWDDRTVVQMQPGERRTFFLHMGQRAPWPWEGDGIQFVFSSTNHDVATLRSTIQVYQDGSERTIVAVVVNAGIAGLATLRVEGVNVPPDTVQVRVGNPMAVTTASLPAGTVGAAYSQQLAAVGGTLPLSWQVTGGSLPNGLQLSTGGVISGTPTAAGTFNFTVRATDAGSPAQTATANLSITVNQVTGTMTLTPSPKNVPLGGATTLTLGLSTPAPAGGLSVTVSSNNIAVATVPPAVVVPAGQSQVNVTVTGVQAGTAVINVSAPNFGTTSAQVNVTSLNTIVLPQGLRLAPGQALPFPVTLSQPAASTMVLNLVNPNTNLVTLSQSQVTIQAGATTPNVQPTVSALAVGTANISANASGAADASTSVVVGFTMTLSPTPLSLNPGATQNMTLNLDAAVQTPFTATLASSNMGRVTVPASVTVPTGASSATFAVTGVSAGQATVTASASGLTNATATVNVTGSNQIIVPASTPLLLEQVVPFTVTLPTPAPPQGVLVSLVVSQEHRVTMPDSVFIPGGQTSGTVMITGVNTGSPTITASASGYANGVGTLVVSATILWDDRTTVVMQPGERRTFFLHMGQRAPWPWEGDGIIFNFTSTDHNVATIRPSINVYQDGSAQTIVAVVVTAGVQGRATLTVSGINVPTDTLQIQVGTGLLVTTTTLPAGTVGAPYSQSLTASGGAPPYSWAIAGGNLPASLTLGAAGGITGTPSAPGTSNFTARVTDANGLTATAPLTLAVNPGSLTLGPNVNLTAGGSGPMTVTLSSPAPAGGVTVNLTSSATGVATVPASVIVAAGSTTANVTVNGVAPGSATITASSANYGTATATAQVSTGLVVTTTTLPNGTVGAVYNQTLASSGGTNPLSWSLQAGSALPAGLNLSAAGVISGTPTAPGTTAFTVRVQDSSVPQRTATQLLSITVATSGGGGGNVAITLTPNPVTAFVGGTTTMTASSSSPAPIGGYQLTLLSSNPTVAGVPLTVTIPGGLSSTTFTLTGISSGTSIISAANSLVTTGTATVTVSTGGSDIVLPQNFVVGPGETKTFPVSLAAPRAMGTFISLTTNDTEKAIFQNPSVFVPAGQTSPNSQPRLVGVAAGPVNITATSEGLATANVNARVGYALAFAPNPLKVSGPGVTSWTLTLSSPSPNPVTVNLTSSNTAVATVPPTFTFSPGITDLLFNITAVTPGTTTVTVTALGLPDTTGTIEVLQPGAVNFGTPEIPLGGSVAVPVTLSQPAPVGGVTVSLNSGNPGVFTIAPGSVFVPGGQTQPVTQPQATGVTLGSAQLNGTAPGYVAGAATLNVRAVATWANPTASIDRDTAQGQMLNLSAPAPAGGITMNLVSSDPAIASVPATILLAPGMNAVEVPITGVAGGTATITASATGVTSTTISVTVVPPLTMVSPQVPNGSVNTAYSYQLLATGGRTPYTWQLTGGTLPAGLTMTPAGLISGTPTAAVNSTPLTFLVTDSSNPQQSRTLSSLVTITPQAPSSIAVVSGHPQTAVVNTAYGAPLVVTVRDTANQPVPGITVLFSAPATGASADLGGGNVAQTLTDASGNATLPAPMANTRSGQFLVTASVSGVASTATFQLTNTPGVATQLVNGGGTPQQTAFNSPFPQALQARARDQFGNGVPGVSVTFTAPGTGASARFSNSLTTITVVTDVAGNAAAPLTANAVLGQYQATAQALSTTLTYSLTNLPGPPATVTPAPGSTPQQQLFNVAFGQLLQVTVRDSGGNPTPDVPVTFALPPSGATGAFPGGAISVTVNTNALGVATAPVLTANNVPGAWVATATAGTATGTFNLTNVQPNPNSLVILSGDRQSALTLTQFGARLAVRVFDNTTPVPGLTVSFAVSPGLTGASGAFAGQGAVTVTTDAQGLAMAPVLTANGLTGTFSVVASVVGYTPTATFLDMTNLANSGLPLISVPSQLSVGQNLQAQLNVSIPTPAPAGGLPLLVVSRNPSLVAVAGRPGDAGTGSLQVTILEGLRDLGGLYLQGLASSGTATIEVRHRVTAPAQPQYTTGLITVTLTPSGMILSGPGAALGSYQMYSFDTAALTITAARLTPELAFAENQTVRGGLSALVGLTNSTPALGSLTASQVVVPGGQGSATVGFIAGGSVGTTTVTATPPSGFSTPASGANTLQLNIVAGSVKTPSVTVGRNLQAAMQVELTSAVPPGGVTITLTSPDASRLQFARLESGAGLSPTYTINLEQGRTRTPDIYVHSMGGGALGTVNFQVSAGIFGTTTGTATITESGLVMMTPFGRNANFFTVVGGGDTALTLTSARFDGGVFQEVQKVRAGLTVNIGVTSSQTGVGTIVSPNVSIVGPAESVQTAFRPVTPGSSTVTATGDNGFGSTSALGTVDNPGFILTNVDVGNLLQVAVPVQLFRAAGPGGVQVTVTSNDPAKLKISPNATSAGGSSASLTIPQGSQSATFFLQGFLPVGLTSDSATYTVTATGYQTGTRTVNVTPSGVILRTGTGTDAPLGGSPIVGTLATTVGTPRAFGVRTARLALNTSTFSYEVVEDQALAGGLQLPSVGLTLTPGSMGSVPATVAIDGVGVNPNFTPTGAAGSSGVITVSQPNGFTAPSVGGSMPVRID